MKVHRLLNPIYVYERRSQILPVLRTKAWQLVRLLRTKSCQLERRLASWGWPITTNSRRLAGLKNRHKGQRCFIIGNGPSLRISDLDRLKGEITFAANKIYLAFDHTDWRPTYYTIEDILVADQNREAINGLCMFPKLLRYETSKFLSGDSNTIWYDMHHHQNWQLSGDFLQFSESPLQGLYWGSTVTYINLQLAYFMGCRAVYLLGMDFSFDIPNLGPKTGRIVSQRESNHFVPNYRKEGELWHAPRLDDQEKAFRFAKEFCEQRGLRIFNATRGGKLEVFPRVDFDTLFG